MLTYKYNEVMINYLLVTLAVLHNCHESQRQGVWLLSQHLTIEETKINTLIPWVWGHY